MLAVNAAPIICKRVVASFDMLDEKLELLKIENELRQRRLVELQQVAMVSLQTELDTKQETFALVDDEVNSKTFFLLHNLPAPSNCAESLADHEHEPQSTVRQTIPDTASNAHHRSIRANNDRQRVVEGRESSSVSDTIFELVESINEGWRGPKVGGARDGSVEWRSKDSVVAHARLGKQGLTKKRAHLLARLRERYPKNGSYAE
jgi:hypothetical protein